MAATDTTEQYFVYENRLASFQGPHPVKRNRASNASSRAPKALSWPHKFLPPFELAKAGFYFAPTSDHPDNVACFLCDKQMDGWEPDDNPIEEHLNHSPCCGWAVTAAVEAEHDGFEQVDPREAKMLDARKATFAGRWPYESKKGWKCKTKQLAEAGWKYTPTNESDDNTTCAYCQLALDGWEASDKPMDEHYKRSPDCPFFELINKLPAPPKKSSRSKAAQSSKTSRMSMQSVATAASDLTSITDVPADHDDSVMTTASAMTQKSRKTTRAKKAPATAKGRKTRAKKDEPIDIHEDVEPQEAEIPPPPPPKPTRGRKRGSDNVEDSVITNAEAPAAKKRATRARASQNVDSSIITTASQQDVEMADAPVPAAKANTGRKRGATVTKGRPRKASAASVASTASTASLRAKARAPDNDELERQLQADLDRPLTDDEDLAADSDSERRKAAAATKARVRKPTKKAAAATTRSQQEEDQSNGDYAMFDPSAPQADEAAVEADLQALEAEMSAVQQQQQPVAEEELTVPKKGRKAAGTRKASKQVKKTAAKEVVAATPAPVEPEPAHREAEEDEDATPTAQLAQEVEAFHDAVSELHDSSTATIVKPTYPPADQEQEQQQEQQQQQQQQQPPPKKARGRPKKSSTESQATREERHPAPPAPAAAPEPAPQQQARLEPARVEVHVETFSSRASLTAARGTPVKPFVKPAVPTKASSPDLPRHRRPLPQLPQPAPSSSSAAVPRRELPAPPPATPRAWPASKISTVPSARQAALSPSQSPQSSDAENQPPSSRGPAPSSSAAAKRIVFAPAGQQQQQQAGAGAPVSPSKFARGPYSTTDPWTTVDLDCVFGAAGGDGDGDGFMAQGGELTSPERRMTVEEWIYYNASQAERKLKHECEAMVITFEREGNRARLALEGLVVEA